MHYSLIEGFFWASYSAIFAYASVYLLHYGFTNSQVGYVIAAGGVVSAILQPLTGRIADASPRNILHRIAIILSFVMIGAAGLLLMPGMTFWVIALLYGVLVAFLQVITPILYAAGMFFIKKGVNINFGIARGIGSISYAGLASLLGILTESVSVDTVIYSVIIIYLLLIILILTFHFKGVDELKEAVKASESGGSVKDFFKENVSFAILLLGSVLLFTSHNIIGNYMFQICANIGYGAKEMGVAMSVMAAMELPTLFLLTAINRRIASGYLLKASGVFMCIKSLVLWLAGSYAMVLFAMVFQMFGYGLFAGISVIYVTHTIKEKDQTMGQSLMTMTMTLGAVIGSLLGGIILDRASVFVMLLYSTAFALVGAIVLIIFSKKGKN